MAANATSRILGEAMTPYQKRIYKDPERAYNWARKYKQRFPEAEAAIARYPFYSHHYAKDVIGGRWPEGEAAIATSPGWAYRYAKNFIGGRWPEAEATIAKDPDYSIMYLEVFPEAKLEWAMNGLIDWTDL